MLENCIWPNVGAQAHVCEQMFHERKQKQQFHFTANKSKPQENTASLQMFVNIIRSFSFQRTFVLLHFIEKKKKLLQFLKFTNAVNDEKMKTWKSSPSFQSFLLLHFAVETQNVQS